MTNGFFAGGAATGLASGLAGGSEVVGRGLELGQRGRALQLKEQEAQQTQRFKELKLASDSLQTLQDSLLKEVSEGRADPERIKSVYGTHIQGMGAVAAMLGTTPQALSGRFNQLVDAQLTPAQKGQRAGEAAVSEELTKAQVGLGEFATGSAALREFDNLKSGLEERGFPSQESDRLARLAVFNDKPASSSEFLQLVDREQALVAEGVTSTDPKLAAIRQRQAKLLSTSTFQVRYSPETGEFQLTMGQPLPSGLADRLQAKEDAIDRGVGLVDSLLAANEQNPALFGSAGSFLRAARTVTGVSGDLGELVKKATGLDVNSMIGTGIEEAQRVLGTNADPAVQAQFDRQLDSTTLFENILALLLLEAEKPEGTRVTDKLFAEFKEQVRLTGMLGSNQVANRLITLRERFRESRKFITGRRQQEVAPRPGGTSSATAAGGDEREELRRKVREILGTE